MFDWFFYIVAVLLAAPVVAVIALVRSIQLNKRLRGVELKLAMLERQSAPAVPDKKTTLRDQALADAGVQAMLEVFPAEIRDVEEM